MLYVLLSLLPVLLGIILIALLKNESKLIKPVAVFAGAIPLVAVVVSTIQIGTTSTYNWFSVQGLSFPITVSFLPLNALLFLLVSLIAPLVLLYSNGFMDLLYDNKRFYVQMLAFETSMLIFSISGNFILLFVAWEFLSVTSYLLIGFWNSRESAGRAAREAITIVFLGDIALLASMVILFHAYQTLDFATLLSDVESMGINMLGISGFALLTIAVFTKSAQFPFQGWLPAAMEGPTPVSAFLHSSTMVKAGVFVVIILYPIFQAAHLLLTITVVGAITVLIGISNALWSMHVKKVLAYSTVEELGLMLFALGIGDYSAAVFFFFAQTFYKALLFFYAGVLMKANGTENLNEMKEAAHNRLLFFSALFGVLALAGFVPFNGFFANVLLEEGALPGIYAYAFMLIVDMSVSLLILRWFLLPAQKVSAPTKRNKLHLGYETIPRTMIYPMVILAVACLLSGFIFTHVGGIITSMSIYEHNPTATFSLGITDMVLETVAVLIGGVLAYRIYYIRKSKTATQRSFPFTRLLNNSSAFDLAYVFVSNFGYYLAGLFELIDVTINEAQDSLGKLIAVFGRDASKIETGQINMYALLMVIGLICLVLFVVIG